MLTGCTNLSYYAQSLNGHLNIVAASQPIDRVVADSTHPKALRDRLALARDIRQFAIDVLKLPDNDSYRNYVETGRDFVTWSVFAAPELSLNVQTWCFPVMGCVPYRGYFSREDAVKFAESAAAQGFDVHVGGVPAYSTLGWFNDPLLNTMLRHGETYLAGVIFHELSHQRVYVQDDTAFNEAFAVAVEQAGTEAWLKSRNDTAAIREYRRSQGQNDDFVALIAKTRRELQAIYESSMSDTAKREAKAAAIERLRARYRRMKHARWGGDDGYDQWFDTPINNAKLATVSVYNDYVPAFSRLLKSCGGDYDSFYGAVARIGALEKDERFPALDRATRCE